MSNLSSVLIAVVIWEFVSCEWAAPRGVSSETVRRCYADMARDGDISHLLLEVTSPEEIDHFCGRISRLKKCVSDYEHYLSTAENTEYLKKTAGVSSFYLNVCPPGTDITSKYKGNAPCFHLIKSKILSCGSDLPDLSGPAIQKDEQRRCCLLEQHRDCMTKATAESCGNQAAEAMKQILLRYFRPQSRGCENQHDCRREIYTRDQDSFYGDEHEVRSSKDWKFHTDDCKTTTIDEWEKPKRGNGVATIGASVLTVLTIVVSATTLL